MTQWRLKRVYAPIEASDGLRVLVDRLWPRGLTKEAARIDLWLRDLAPSDAWRKRLHADLGLWEAFRADYARALGEGPAAAAVAQLLAVAQPAQTVTLLFAAREEARNNAVALRDWLIARE